MAPLLNCSSAQPEPELCKTVVPLVLSLRDEAGSGFGEGYSLVAAPDLYQSAWSVALGRELGMSDESLLVDQDWVRSILEDADTGARTGLEELESLHLASWLSKEPDAGAMKARLGTLRTSDGLASFAPGGPSSIAAVAVYVETAARLGLPQDAAMLRKLTERVRTATAVTRSELIEDVIPALRAITSVGPVTPHLIKRGTLVSWRDMLTIDGDAPLSLSLLDTLQRAAKASGVDVDRVAPAWLFATRSLSGMVALKDGSDGDPQATLYALRLGADLDRQSIIEELQRRKLPQGWVQANRPNLLTTSFALATLDACGVDPGLNPHSNIVRTGAAATESLSDLEAISVCVSSARTPGLAEAQQTQLGRIPMRFTGAGEGSLRAALDARCGSKSKTDAPGSVIGPGADMSMLLGMAVLGEKGQDLRPFECGAGYCWSPATKESGPDAVGTALGAILSDQQGAMGQFMVRGLPSLSIPKGDGAEVVVNTMSINAAVAYQRNDPQWMDAALALRVSEG